MNGWSSWIDFILADVELGGVESFSFYLNLAKYITLIGEIVAPITIFLKQSIFENPDNYI